MFPNHWKSVMIFFLLASMFALAGDTNDQLSYCSYVMQQAEAQRDLLRTPTAFGGFTQPETGLPLQIVGGASLGLSECPKEWSNDRCGPQELRTLQDDDVGAAERAVCLGESGKGGADPPDGSDRRRFERPQRPV